jgi:DNA-directed RNA polymerase subunit M/transcription elongation factor TFIIS
MTLYDEYNLKASKLIGDKQTVSEIKKGFTFFELSTWEEYKVAQQMRINFSCRKRDLVKGEHVCKKCGTDTVYIESIQMRSADEAAFVFALCSNYAVCKNKPWRIG